MPDFARISCTRCKQSIFNCMIDGPNGARRVPIVTRINAGQPDDTGPFVAVDDPDVRMTSFTREFMQSRVARIELCEKCLAEFFGWALVTPAEDPMFESTRSNSQLQRSIDAIFDDASVSKLDKFAHMHMRTLHAAHVAWDEARPEDLPPALQPPATMMPGESTPAKAQAAE